MDLATGFLYGDLEEDIFMEVPDGFKNLNRANMVCKLQISLYGLSQAPRQNFLVKIAGHWDEYVEALLFAYNAPAHRITDLTPFGLVPLSATRSRHVEAEVPYGDARPS